MGFHSYCLCRLNISGTNRMPYADMHAAELAAGRTNAELVRAHACSGKCLTPIETGIRCVAALLRISAKSCSAESMILSF